MTTIKPALDLAARAVVAQRTEAIFRSTGGYREGHFLLPGGRHAEGHVETLPVLADPAATNELCGFWAARMRGTGPDGARPLVDVVVGPATAGAILAFETARQLGVRSGFAEPARDLDGGIHRSFPRGFAMAVGERVLIVDDVLVTGGSMRSMLAAVESVGGEIVECGVLVDRRGGRATLTSPTTGLTYPVRVLWHVDVPRYDPGEETCPRCAAGDPLEMAGGVRAVAHERS